MIDRANPIPLYIQLENDLKDKIQKGTYAVGQKIPTETGLMEMYNVSRMTVRNAITSLSNEGYLVKSQGDGTYVKNRKSTQEFNQITSWTDTMRGQGHQISSELLRAEKVAASAEIAARLMVDAGTPVYLLDRLRCCDGMPITYVRNYILASIVGPDFLDVVRKEYNSLYTLMEQRYGMEYSMARETVGARMVNAKEAQLLGVYRGFPIINNIRVCYNEKETPFEVDISSTRADKYQLTITMRGRPGRHP